MSLAYLLTVSSIGLFPCTAAKVLWSSTPAASSDVIRQAYPVGNGRLGALPFGKPGAEVVNLNVDSLWSGGPFEVNNYTGDNPVTEKYTYLPGIRSWIFQNGTGNVSELLGTENDYYGSYQVLGNLTVSVEGVTSASQYNRSLDLTTGLHTTRFIGNDKACYSTVVYCSYPDQVCVYQLTSDAPLPDIAIGLENQFVNSTLQTQTCENGFVRLTGLTQLGPPTGMKYDAIARIAQNGYASQVAHCDSATGILTVPSSNGTKSLTIVVGAGTDYDQTKGDLANNFSFRGKDPAQYVQDVTRAAAAKSPQTLLHAQIADYQSFSSAFSLELPDPANSAGMETAALLAQYNSTGPGDSYIESLLFDYGRHLFISSSRENSLPPNLQGRWSTDLTGAWSCDYHANVNLQMNHWLADQTGLGGLQTPLWNYMQNTWVPRGSETAKLLYGAPGWVTHDELNIFGNTGMKYQAQWADYPASAAWMMEHVWDHYSYSLDKQWLQNQGYPLLKGVAQFWLSQLQYDEYFKDGTVVVNPCNSPEHGPTTFGCTHYQQLLHQLFDSILTAATIISEPDTTFLSNVSSTLEKLDKGFHPSTFATIKEWKLPDSFGYDFPNDTHRHLSHLIGWFPGYSLAALLPFTDSPHGYTSPTLTALVANSLLNRGPGNGPDANAGWEKVWRAACWARLNNTAQAYFELRYAVEQNFAPNGLSMYSGRSAPFQIDANFGIAGAVLAMLVVDLPLPFGAEGRRTVVLGPAIPPRWGPGKVRGLRLRAGGVADFEWGSDGLVTKAVVRDSQESLSIVNKKGNVLLTV